MSGWLSDSSQPEQAGLAQALHDFGDVTDQAVRAWAGQLTMRQALDITCVLTDILRLLGTTAERLSHYQTGSKQVRDHGAGPNQPNEEIAQAHASISSARAALVHLFRVLAAVQGERHRGGCVGDGERRFRGGSGCGRVACDDTVSTSDMGRPSPLPFREARGGP
jgi:hypothetical protein